MKKNEKTEDQQDKKLSSDFLFFLTKIDPLFARPQIKKKKNMPSPPPQKKKINFNLFFLDIYLLQ